MARFSDRGNYFEIKGSGVNLRISKSNGTVTDPTAELIKSDIGIAVDILTQTGHKDLADKVAKKYRGKFD